MAYSNEQIDQLQRDLADALVGLENLSFKGAREAIHAPNDNVRRFLTHGIGRRLSVLKRSLGEIFMLFPPERAQPLSHDETTLLQIYLHAFVINLAGVFDNFAWAFIHRHGLRDRISHFAVSIFKKEMQRYLPESILEFLRENELLGWHGEYAKHYRDALAHRIPLYVPPSLVTEAEAAEHQRLGEERLRLIAEGEYERENETRDRQLQLGAPAFFFMHDIDPDQDAQMVWMHPQLLCDASTVIEFGKCFFESWQDSRTD